MKIAVNEPLSGRGSPLTRLLFLVYVDAITLVESVEDPRHHRQRRRVGGGTQQLLAHRQNGHFRIAPKQEEINEARLAFEEVNHLL